MKRVKKSFLIVSILIGGLQFFFCGKKLFGPENGTGSILIRLSLNETTENSTSEVHALSKAEVDIAEVMIYITGPGIEKIEKRLSVNPSEQRVSGTIEDIPAGSDRKVRIELNDNLSGNHLLRTLKKCFYIAHCRI